MAVEPLGARAPSSIPSSGPSSGKPPLRLVRDTRTRRNHGAFTLGGQLACVYSTRQAGRCYGVSFELGAGTLTLASAMTAGQARAMARALDAAAAAADSTSGGVR